jgi:transposase
MANHIKVATAQSILTLRQQGWSYRRIARTLGIHRETAARYVRLARAKPAKVSPGPETPDASKSAKVSPGPWPAEGLRPAGGNPTSRSLSEPCREVILEKLDQGLTAKRIWQDLVADHGFTAGYSSVKRFVSHLKETTPLPFRRMESPPGEEAQVDFGLGAPVEQPGGRAKRFPVLRVVLSYSRKAYSEALPRQGTEEFLRALENAFRAFGGVPRTLVVDNLKAAVTRADWYDPEIHPKLRDFCRHYSCIVLPTRPYTPRHKGKVEAGVKYLRRNALAGKRFASLRQENESLQAWEASVADLRIHGTTKKQVKTLFEEEKPHLLRLPESPFPCFREARRIVSRDAHVEVEKAYYSVPPEYLAHRVWVRWDAAMVRIFNDRMEPIAVHARGEAGRFRTDPRHIASEKIAAVERGAGWLLKRLALVGPETLRWAQACLEERGIQGIRVLVGLLAMTGKYRSHQIERACEMAFSHGAWRLRALRQLMEEPKRQEAFLQTHPLIRPIDFYGQRVRVSFQKQNNRNSEFIALEAPSGALSSGPVEESLPDESFPVNFLERSDYEQPHR